MIPARRSFSLFAAGGLVLLLGLGACAKTYEPIVDLKDVDRERYQQDLEECRAYGDKVDIAGDLATDTAVGAGGGALVGAAVGGAVGGYAGRGALLGVAAGGATGLGTGTRSSLKHQKVVIRRCLKLRGYKVLG